MKGRTPDGSAGDVDHGSVGQGYADHRKPDDRIAARIRQALGDARTVVNVGAGAGSYEATTLDVTAVEPSASMRAQRPAHLSRAVDAVAEQLPFADDSFDAAMTTFSVHQWSDPAAGRREMRREMRRVARGPVVVLTCDPDMVRGFWLYACFVDAQARARFTADLRRDLDSGGWDKRFGALREQPYCEGSLVMLRSVPA